MINRKKCDFQKRKGVFTTLTAAGLVTFVGFMAMVVDMGMVYSEKATLETAVSSGADLGKKMINELNKTNEPVQSGDVRVITGIKNLLAAANPNYLTQTTITVTPDRVTVNGKSTVNMVFAQVLGLRTMDVVANASSDSLVGGGKMKNIPLVIPHGDPQQIVSGGKGIAIVTPFTTTGFQPGTKYLLKLGEEPKQNSELDPFKHAIFTVGNSGGGAWDTHVNGNSHNIIGGIHSNGTLKFNGAAGKNDFDGGFTSGGNSELAGFTKPDGSSIGAGDANIDSSDIRQLPNPPKPFTPPSTALSMTGGANPGVADITPNTSSFDPHKTVVLPPGTTFGNSLGGKTIYNTTIYVNGDLDLKSDDLTLVNSTLVVNGSVKFFGNNFNIDRTDVDLTSNGPISIQVTGAVDFQGNPKDGVIDGGMYASAVDSSGNPAPNSSNFIHFGGANKTINGPIMGNEVHLGGNTMTINNGPYDAPPPVDTRYFFGPSDPNLTDTTSGASQYESLLKFGYDGVVGYGDQQGPEGGVLTDQTTNGTTYYDSNPDINRLVVLPIVEYNDPTKAADTSLNLYDANSSDEFKVVGSALFELDTPGTQTSGTSSEGLTGTDQTLSGQITGTFVRYIIPPPGFSN